MNKYFIHLVLTSILLVSLSCSRDHKSYLSELDHEIELRSEYDDAKEKRIQKIKRLLTQSLDVDVQKDLLWDLVTEYRTYQSDSTEVFSIKLIDLGEENGSEEIQALGMVGLIDRYNSGGYFKEASDVLSYIKEDHIPDDIRPFYLDLLYRLLGNLEAYEYNSKSGIKENYREQRIEFLNEIIENTLPDNYEHDAAEIELSELNGEDQKNIIARRKQLLDKYQISLGEMANQYSKIAVSSENIGDKEGAKEYLAKGVIAAIKNSSKETNGLKNLAQLMYEEQNWDRASEYITLALEDADFYGSQLRKVEIGALLPSIENDRYKAKNHQFIYTLVALWIAIVLLLLSLALFLEIRRKNEKLRESYADFKQFNEELREKRHEVLALREELKDTQENLQETSEIKDHYIMQALYFNTKYLDTLENKASKLISQLREKKSFDIKLIDTQLGIKEERQRILKAFDKAFLRLFPNFIDDVNKFFKKEDQIKIEEGEEFPTELRIFALIRLGISDPAEIAKLLNLTVNTVYVYKTKFKSKSLVENSEFDKLIMKIKRP